MCRNLPQLLGLVVGLLCLSFIDAEINASGLCALYVFVPFTDNGTATTSFFQPLRVNGDKSRAHASSNVGFDHMAAALLAMDHFNSRDPTVVPELARLQRCPIYFDMNNTKFFDSDVSTHLAIQTLVQQPETPCAIVGGSNDLPTLDLTSQATAYKYAQVAYRAYNLRVSSPSFAPYSSQVYPNLPEQAARTVDYLRYWNRTNFTAVLYPMTDLGMQQRELLEQELAQRDMLAQTVGYLSSRKGLYAIDVAERIGKALRAVKERGYRTIVVTLDQGMAEVPVLARAADELGLNNGDYFWVWFGFFDPMLLDRSDPLVAKLIYGSAFVTPLERFIRRRLSNESDPFVEAYAQLDSDFIAQLNAVNPIPRGEPGFVRANSATFRGPRIEIGSGFMYDAVMSVGVGACLAWARSGYPVNGDSHVEGIRQTGFMGASGYVGFNQDILYPGVRNESTVGWGALNLLPVADNSSEPSGREFTIADQLPPVIESPGAPNVKAKWQPVVPFTFADGSKVPPELLRNMPDQNYLDPGIRGFCYALMGTMYFAALVAAGWIFRYRNHRVMKAAQPTFLYIIVLGACILVTTIAFLINDESYGWTEDQLSTSCSLVPWFVAFGYMIQYLALFSKLWRVQRVLQFQRQKIQVWHVLWPAAVLMSAVIIVLVCWTVLDPPYWERIEMNEVTGESIGQCTMGGMNPFVVPLALIVFVPALLTGCMAWKTKDVDDAYAEGWWIFVLFCVQVEILAIGAPLIAILRGVSTDGKIIGYAILLWMQTATALGLILAPKALAQWRVDHGIRQSAHKRGESIVGHVRVSGLQNPIRESVLSVRESGCTTGRSSQEIDPGTIVSPDASWNKNPLSNGGGSLLGPSRGSRRHETIQESDSSAADDSGDMAGRSSQEIHSGTIASPDASWRKNPLSTS